MQKMKNPPSTIHSRGIFVLEFKHKVSEEVMEKFLASVLMVKKKRRLNRT